MISIHRPEYLALSSKPVHPAQESVSNFLERQDLRIDDQQLYLWQSIFSGSYDFQNIVAFSSRSGYETRSSLFVDVSCVDMGLFRSCFDGLFEHSLDLVVRVHLVVVKDKRTFFSSCFPHFFDRS